jgi:endonuclease G
VRYAELNIINNGLNRLLTSRQWMLKEDTFIRAMISLSNAAAGTRVLGPEQLKLLESFVEGLLREAPAPAAANAPIAWTRPDDEQLERLLSSSSTLLDVAFFRKGIELAAGVFLIIAKFENATGKGTAFRVGERHILTNHHVVHHGGAAASSIKLVLHYEIKWGEVDKPNDYSGYRTIEAQASIVACEKVAAPAARDWALLELPDDLPADVSTIRLDDASVPQADGRAYIIQHPEGLAKRIGINRNLIRSVDDHVLQYLTDTEAGSSGSPVFDEQWRLIGLHYRWVDAPTESKFKYRNEGMRIEPIRKVLAQSGIVLK